MAELDYEEDGFDGELEPVLYPESEEQLLYTGFAGLGDTQERVCAAENDDFHWMRMNVCADYEYRRGEAEEIPIKSSRDVSDFFRSAIPFDISTVELMAVIILNTKNVPVGVYEVHRGGIDASVVDPRAVFQPAILLGAGGIILCHNHPSGDSTPSSEDIAITEKLATASNYLGVRFLDHIVLGREDYFSFADAGMLPE